MGFDVWLELWSQTLEWWSSPQLKGLPFIFFPFYLETAFPNYIICVCLAIKAARHHFVVLLESKTCNWCSLFCPAAVECSLLDQAFVEGFSDFGGGAGGRVLPKGKGSDCVIWGTLPGCAQEISQSINYPTTTYWVKTFHVSNFNLTPQVPQASDPLHLECQAEWRLTAFLRNWGLGGAPKQKN